MIEYTTITISGKAYPAEKGNVTRTEFYQASALGYRPSGMYKVHCKAYNGEDRIYTNEGACMSVIRSYQDGDYIELYVERKLGKL